MTRDCRIGFWTDDDMINEVMAYAKREYISRAEAIRQLVEFGLEAVRDGQSSAALQQASKRRRVHKHSRAFKEAPEAEKAPRGRIYTVIHETLAVHGLLRNS
jgi:hypothetical protein